MVSSLIDRTISQRPILEDSLFRRLNNEVVPVVRRIRSVVNEIVSVVNIIVEANPELKNWLLVDASNDPMEGNLDMGGFDLTNFHTKAGDKTSLAGGGGLTTVLIYPTALEQYELMRVGVEVALWEAGDRSVCGHAVTEVSVYGTGSGIALSRTDFLDTNALPSGADVALTSSGTGFLVQAQATTNDCYALARLWHQPKYALTV
jgi:hypothetical protein